jgi:hypothetical protein
MLGHTSPVTLTETKNSTPPNAGHVEKLGHVVGWDVK